MFHSFAYPDETGVNELGVRLWEAKMTDGEIVFTPPAECDPKMYRRVRAMEAKIFGKKFGNFTSLEEGDDSTL